MAVISERMARQTCYYNRTWPFVAPLSAHPAAALHNMRIGNSADKLSIVPKWQADQENKHNMGLSAEESKQQHWFQGMDGARCSYSRKLKA